MNVFAKFDEFPSMILQNIKETKLYGRTVGRTDNVKTVYPPTNTVCGGYKHINELGETFSTEMKGRHSFIIAAVFLININSL